MTTIPPRNQPAMTTKQQTLLALGGIGSLLILFLIGCSVHTVNREVDLRTAINAKSTANEAALDTMWKTLKQKANISDKAIASVGQLNEVYAEIVEGRQGGMLFKAVTESHPDLGQKEALTMFKDLMASVEAERKIFKRDQLALVDLVRERDSLINRIPSKWIIGMFGDNTPFKRRKGPSDDEYTYVFVTSESTDRMATSGQENDIELWDKQ